MEKIYGCGELDYTSEPICLRDFLTEASLQHHPFVHGQISEEGITKNLEDNAYRERMLDMMNSNLTDSEFTDLENICSSDNLADASMAGARAKDVQTASLFSRVDLPQKSDLETVKRAKIRTRFHERHMKYAGILLLEKSQKSSKSQKDDLTPGTDLFVVIRIYAPFKHKIGKRSTKIATGGQEIAVLGSQTLADLRDKFPCASDHIICQDLSSNPFCKTMNMAKDKYKSGMIYIGDKFYDDTRHSSNIEYSETVLKWAKERHLNLGNKAKMEDTNIIDLSVRLGYPYLYQHQGNCEHLFCFSDIRLLHQSDPLQRSLYPSLRSMCRQHSRYCMLCGHYIAKWVTVGNSRVPHDPCYFCQTCFFSYNYVDNQKIGEFAAYPFSDSASEFIAQV